MLKYLIRFRLFSRKTTIDSKVLHLFVMPLILTFYVPALHSQASISGIINQYSAVESVDGTQSVTVADVSPFQPRDTVLLIQMKGMGIEIDDDPQNFGRQQDLNNSGHYEFLVISEIDYAERSITFTREFLEEYSASETVQLVRARGFESATVTGTLTAMPWDGEKGGILAMIVTNTLYLEADIDLSETGFRGAEPVTLTDEICASQDPEEFGRPAYPEGSDKAGRKGEGAATYYIDGDDNNIPLENDFVHGRGRLATGGGGGNGLFSGGGGGANYGTGGRGGDETDICSDPGYETRGIGGYRLSDQLRNPDGTFVNRLFMAGGGGGSTRATGREATPGGRGGGMVVIVANYIEGSEEFGIYADGGSVTETATAGAGGGGGGGTIVASIDHYLGQVNMRARGGKGGDVSHEDKGGPGGGGGGGVIIFSGSSLPPAVNTSLLGGAAGTNIIQGDPHGTEIGVIGGLIEELEINMNGILFNGIRTERDTICEATVPYLLEGTRPRGGDTPYDYIWFRRLSGETEWTAIDGADQQHYQPEPLTETTEFMRVVEDTSFPRVIDSSNILTITIQPMIMGNTIYNEQTICEGDIPGTLEGDTPTQGGTGVFEYLWNSSAAAGQQWTEIDDNNGGLDYSPPSLTDSTLFVRVALSGVCVDTSNTIAVNVHPAITGNVLDDDQTICYGDTPLPVGAPTGPGGALGEGSYSYEWEILVNGEWDTLNGDETSETYTPGSLTSKTGYRRTVESGACRDTSPPHTITVLPLITGNTISDDQTICYLDSPELFNGSEPSGGDGIFSYLWEASSESGTWIAADGEASGRNYQSPPLSDTTSFRRIVKSGENDACKDTSNMVAAVFHQLAFGSVTPMNDTICIGEESTITFTLSGEGPWDMVFTDDTEQYIVEGIDSPTYAEAVSPETTDSATYTYTIASLTDRFGCVVPPEHLTGSAGVRIYAYPDPDPGTGGEVCGPLFELNANPGLGHGIWETSAPVTFSPAPSSPQVTVMAEEYGTHTLTWTETNWKCAAGSDITVTFYEQPEDVSAGEDQNLHYLFEVYLEAELPPGMPEAYGIWEVVDGTGNIVFPDDSYTGVTGMSFGENVFRWTLYNGVCDPVYDIVTIFIRDLDTPTGFSPNNSGYNDTFVIRGLENSTVNELTIFNRQGNVVFSTVNYMNDWDGRNHNGVPLPEDTYYYILSVDNTYSYKGFIVLRR